MSPFPRPLRLLFALVRPRLLALPGVVGAGLGERERGGVPTGERALVVFVVSKRPPSELPPGARVPRRVGPLTTDVIPLGRPRALALPGPRVPTDAAVRRGRVRPAPPGVSVGHYRAGSGTLGAVVRDRRSGAPLILSNNHVLANRSAEGGIRAFPGDPVLQPGPADGGTLDDTLARLVRFVPLRLERSSRPAPLRAAATPSGSPWRTAWRLATAANRVDAAVAAPVDPGSVTPEVLGLHGPPGPPRAAAPGDRVVKSGRTSGVTEGRVRAISATVRVEMGGGWSALFVDQIVTTPMAEPGDSGSLLLDREGRAVGLVAAGSDQGTIANPIGAVLAELGVELAGG